MHGIFTSSLPSRSRLTGLHALCRSQLCEAEEQGSALMEQQEGAEDLVRALRQELHNLRQDTNSVAANARQTVSEKEALQVCVVNPRNSMVWHALAVLHNSPCNTDTVVSDMTT